MKGTVKWFDPRKKYGFIKGEDGNEYFVHERALAEGTMIKENDEVEFEPAESERGKQAQNVKLISAGEALEEAA